MGGAADFFVSYTSADRPGQSGSHGNWKPRATRSSSRQGLPPGQRLRAADAPDGPGDQADHRSPLSRLPDFGLWGVEPPGLLTTRIYMDLVGKDTADARVALLAAARDARGKPAAEPEFPGAQRRSTLGSNAAPRFPGELPQSGMCPSSPTPSSLAVTCYWLSSRAGSKHSRRPYGGWC